MTLYQPSIACCKAGIARRDITPPIGIYNRSWGAALHETAEGIHRPFTATALALQNAEDESLLLLAVDIGWLEQSETDLIQEKVRDGIGIDRPGLLIALCHSHAGPNLSRSLTGKPGGDKIEPYLEDLAIMCAEAADEAVENLRDALITFGLGRCDLATNRDFWDETSSQFVTGFNSEGEADDTLMVARISNSDGRTVATLYNYGCHPTTLGPPNKLLSPDYIGAAREVIENHFDAPSLFILGACGDTGPREGFVGDVEVADRNGRQLGLAAASALESLMPVGQQFAYVGPIISGTTIGDWQHEPIGEAKLANASVLRSRIISIELPLMPRESEEALKQRYDETAKALEDAIAGGDHVAIRDATALHERARRRLLRSPDLPEGDTLSFEFWLWQVGDAFVVAIPAEPYGLFQTELRRRFPNRPIFVSVVTNGTIAYMLPRDLYGNNFYQEWVSYSGPGCLEIMIDAAAEGIEEWL